MTKAFFQKKIILILLSGQFYICLFIYLFYHIGLWSVTILRESIVFLLFTSISLIIKYISHKERVASIKELIEDTVKATVVIEFYLNIYTFSYCVELIVQFFLALFCLMGMYNKRDSPELRTIYRCSQTMFYGLSFFLVSFSTYMMFSQWRDIFLKENVESLLFPVIVTLVYWPFLYMLSVVSVYEVWFVRIYFASNKEKELYRFRRNQVMKTCKINLDKIVFISKKLHIFTYQNQEEFLNDLRRLEINYNHHQYDEDII